MDRDQSLSVVRGRDIKDDGMTRTFVIIRGTYYPSKLGGKQINEIIREQYKQVVGDGYNPDSLVIRTYNIRGTSKHRDYSPRHIVDVRASVPDDSSSDQLLQGIEAALK